MGKYEDYFSFLKRKYNVMPNDRSYMDIVNTMWKHGMMREEFDKLCELWVEQYGERKHM